MKVKLYAVLDTCSGVYDGPVPSMNDETAMRNFRNMVLQDGNAINKNPEHFILFRVGSWDDSIGEPKGETPHALLKAIDVKDNVVQLGEAADA